MLLVLVAYAFMLFKCRLNGKVLRRSALVILIAGISLYMYGFRLEGYSEGFVTCFLRSLLGAIKMFIYDGSVFEMLKAQSQTMFLDLFYLVLYAAMLTSISTIILLFGKRAMTYLILTFRRDKFKHVFLGVNMRSQTVAKGLKGSEVAFIEFPSDSESEEVSIKQALGNFANDDGTKGKLSGGITVLRAKRDLEHNESEAGVMEQMGLSKLARLVDSDTKFYILSENAEKNLNDLMMFINDKNLYNNTIHASVKREGVARSYQMVLGKSGAHFIYPSSLSIVELMKNHLCHPASVMTIDTNDDGQPNCSASGEFNALVLGFGEAGQAATKFLYEFSSAVRRDGTPLPVKIYINDSKLERLKGQFNFSCPDMEHGDILVYENNGLDSGQFWDTLLERIDKLNFIVISMKDDAVNLDVACAIFGYVQKKRKNGFENFRILVRKKHTPEYERKLVERLNEKAGREVIISFGEYNKVFTTDMIVSEKKSGINKSATNLSDKLIKKYLAVSGKEFKPVSENWSFHEKRKVRMEVHQFISRANHIPSKKDFTMGREGLTEAALENMARCEHLRYSRYLLAHGYSFSEEDDDVMKTNHHLCSWNRLSEEDRQYHRDIVKASLSVGE